MADRRVGPWPGVLYRVWTHDLTCVLGGDLERRLLLAEHFVHFIDKIDGDSAVVHSERWHLSFLINFSFVLLGEKWIAACDRLHGGFMNELWSMNKL